MAARGTLITMREGGLAPWARDLQEARRHAGDLRTGFKRLSKWMSERFARKLRDQGPGWAGLASNTVKQRTRKGFGPRPILWRSGRMFGSLINPSQPDAIERIEKDTYVRGTRVPYTRFHMTGTKRMDARDPFPDLSFTLDRATDFVLEWVMAPFGVRVGGAERTAGPLE